MLMSYSISDVEKTTLVGQELIAHRIQERMRLTEASLETHRMKEAQSTKFTRNTKYNNYTPTWTKDRSSLPFRSSYGGRKNPRSRSRPSRPSYEESLVPFSSNSVTKRSTENSPCPSVSTSISLASLHSQDPEVSPFPPSPSEDPFQEMGVYRRERGRNIDPFNVKRADRMPASSLKGDLEDLFPRLNVKALSPEGHNQETDHHGEGATEDKSQRLRTDEDERSEERFWEEGPSNRETDLSRRKSAAETEYSEEMRNKEIAPDKRLIDFSDPVRQSYLDPNAPEYVAPYRISDREVDSSSQKDKDRNMIYNFFDSFRNMLY